MRKFMIKINGTQYEVEVEEVKTAGGAAPVKAAAPAAPAPAPKPAAPKAEAAVPSGAVTIKSPMPGTILKVNVNAGDSVKKGQVLLILEAMKMENEITAPADGKVVSVNVEKGKAVNAGDVLVALA